MYMYSSIILPNITEIQRSLAEIWRGGAESIPTPKRSTIARLFEGYMLYCVLDYFPQALSNNACLIEFREEFHVGTKCACMYMYTYVCTIGSNIE